MAKTPKKKNCWEFTNCGREPGGKNVDEKGVCPAATLTEADGLNAGKNAGRICWAVAGTYCGGEVQGTFAEKKKTCLTCPFFVGVREEQGLEFSLLIPGQDYEEIQKKKFSIRKKPEEEK